MSETSVLAVALKFLDADYKQCDKPVVFEVPSTGEFYTRVVYVSLAEYKALQEERKLAEELGIEVDEASSSKNLGKVIATFRKDSAEFDSFELGKAYRLKGSDWNRQARKSSEESTDIF